MLKKTRQAIVQNLWVQYRQFSSHIGQIESALAVTQPFTLDHFAIIDLPGPHTGIPILTQLFNLIGYVERGQDYLASKQNDFRWLAEVDSEQLPARDVLAQAVIADFRLDELPPDVRRIISHYSYQAPPLPWQALQRLAKQCQESDESAATQLNAFFMQYLKGRDWPLPTVHEFHTVHAFNELLAWVLVFGRRPNHFTVSVHLLEGYTHFSDFLHFIESDLSIALNEDGGKIKGSREVGLCQGSTLGTPQTVALADGNVQLPGDFVEFIWRYPVCEKPQLWKDYFTGFIKQNADDVIRSLYTS